MVAADQLLRAPDPREPPPIRSPPPDPNRTDIPPAEPARPAAFLVQTREAAGAQRRSGSEQQAADGRNKNRNRASRVKIDRKPTGHRARATAGVGRSQRAPYRPCPLLGFPGLVEQGTSNFDRAGSAADSSASRASANRWPDGHAFAAVRGCKPSITGMSELRVSRRTELRSAGWRALAVRLHARAPSRTGICGYR